MVARRAVTALATGLGAVSSVRIVRAHVEYVAEGDEPVTVGEFVAAVLTDPLQLLLLGGGGALAVTAALGYLWISPLQRDVTVFRETVRGYADLVPWLLRLSIGLPLVGAGFAGYFFSPAVPPYVPGVLAPSRLFQIGIGFLLLFGLATRAAAIVGLSTFLVGLAFDPRLLFAGEYVGGFLAIVLLGSGRPSADQVLQRIAEDEGTAYGEIDPIHRAARWLNTRFEPYEGVTATILRLSLGLTFIFLGLAEKLLAPGQALAVVEKYDLTAVVPVPPELWVAGAGLAEVAIGLVLIAGLFTRAVAVVSLGMFTLTLFGLPDDPVLAHVSLFGMASALVITGAGPYSVDGWFHEADEPVVETGATGTTTD